jgi:glycosidase
VGLALDRRGGDAWTWRKLITGRCVGCEPCTSTYVQAGDERAEIERAGDRFSATIPLAAGANAVSAVCEHQDGRKYTSSTVTYDLRLEDRPRAEIQVSLRNGKVVLDAGKSSPGEGDEIPLSRYAWSARETNPAPIAMDNAKEKRVILSPPSADGEYYVRLRVTDEAGKEDTSAAYFVVEDGTPRLPKPESESPAWVERAIVYGVISRNFGPDGLRSVTSRLGYLQDLGVNTLWLAPINQSAGGFGYEVTDYFKLRTDDGGGTDADLRELVREAHARGMRVVMDFVPNHTSVEHPYFLDAQQHGKASAYYDYYARDEAGNYTYYFDYQHLANLNYDNPEVERWMLEAFAYWVREFDIDGFRVDVAWGIRERKPEYWPVWRRELKRIKPDLLLLAEAPGRDAYYYTQGFDAAYDWASGYGGEYDWFQDLGRWAWENVFDLEEDIPARLRTALTNGGKGFHPDALLFRFLNNNDTGPRFISNHGPELTRVAAALLLTLPGIPCVYTGDEIGAEFEPYDESCCIDWEDDRHRLRPYYKQLIGLRDTLPALRGRGMEILRVESDGSVLAYVRDAGPSERPVLVLLNWGAETAEANVQIPERFGPLGRGGSLRDALAEKRVPAGRGRTLRVTVPGYTAMILTEDM